MVYMYMREPAAGAAVAVPMRSGLVNAAILLAAAGVLILGIFPTHALQLAAAALP
jgi:NADH-quinone oxidoreductase subunit N